MNLVKKKKITQQLKLSFSNIRLLNIQPYSKEKGQSIYDEYV